MIRTSTTLFLVLCVALGCDGYELHRGTYIQDDAIPSTDGLQATGNDTSTWGTSDSIALNTTSTETLDAVDPPDDSINYDPTTDTSTGYTCSNDEDCDNEAFICHEGICIEYLECSQDWHCDDHNACNGDSRCTEHGNIGYCVPMDKLECPHGSTCNPLPGCILPGPPDVPECNSDQGCAPEEECTDRLGYVCTVRDGALCSDTTTCDDFNACTQASCDDGICANKGIACLDRNPGTKDICDPFLGCQYDPFILIEVTLQSPHNQDMVWLRFDSLQWSGHAPYVMHLPVLEACVEGVRLDFNVEGDSPDGWYECPQNPKIMDTIESIIIDGNPIGSIPVPPENNILYDIIDDPEAPCGKALFISRGKLGCPYDSY